MRSPSIGAVSPWIVEVKAGEEEGVRSRAAAGPRRVEVQRPRVLD
jgi:hypothetical protein